MRCTAAEVIVLWLWMLENDVWLRNARAAKAIGLGISNNCAPQVENSLSVNRPPKANPAGQREAPRAPGILAPGIRGPPGVIKEYKRDLTGDRNLLMLPGVTADPMDCSVCPTGPLAFITPAFV